MVDVVKLPKLGLSDFGELVAWEAAVGDRVEADQLLATIESDKASAEVDAPAGGTLLATYVEEGEEIEIEPGRPIAVLGEEGESVPSLADLDGDAGTVSDDEADESEVSGRESATDADDGGSSGSTGDRKVTPRAKRYAQENDVELAGIEGTGPQGAVTEDDVREFEEADGADAEGDTGEVKATPRAKRYAQENDVELAGIEGTGPQGAVTEDDVREFEEAGGATGGADGDASAGGLTVTETRTLSGTRKTIADRLSRSAREKPHVMGTRDISIERLQDVKRRLNEELDVDVSLNDLLLHFVGRTLEDLPEFNAHFEDDEHRLVDEVNVGYAVDSPKGLVVPVVREVPDRSLADLSSERRRLVKAVLEDEHEPADLQGGTFTVTNVGVFDMDVSYSIINPPQVAILAIGRRKPAPVERDGEVRFEETVTFSLTIDHRVLDGADSGAFLEQLAEYVEYPGRAFDAL